MSISDQTLFKEKKENEKLVKKNISELENQIDTIDERFALGLINENIYQKFFGKYSIEMQVLLSKNQNCDFYSSNLEKRLNYVLKSCLKPAKWWSFMEAEQKSRVQKMIFPSGITVSKDNSEVRTRRINLFFAPIVEIAKVLRGKENGQPVTIDQLSIIVDSEGLPAVIPFEVK